MATKTRVVLRLAQLLLLCGLLAGALAAQQKPEDIPDAPSAVASDPTAAATQPAARGGRGDHAGYAAGG